MEIVDTEPDVDVETAEYIRLLGFPRGHVLEGRSLELARWARDWYDEHGRPWVYARRADDLELIDHGVRVNGTALRSAALRRTLDQAGAHAAVLVAVSAGAEVERAAHRAWVEEKPDEYFFLEIFGSAVVEHLNTMTGARLCDWAEGESMAVLPHYSPGYAGWDVGDQANLFGLLRPGLPGDLDVLESGMLRPKKSLLAVFGITSHLDRVRRLTDLVPCENCSYLRCEYRRAPYKRAATVRSAGGADAASGPPYATNVKALQRWAGERLTLTPGADGTIEATFRYDGTTCSNMGRPLTFHYRVTLGPADEGFPIRAQHCEPAPGDEGHRAMCEFMRTGDALLRAIAGETPLAGRKLEDVLTWTRPRTGPGCYCEAGSRLHKWGLALETIHYALTHRDHTPRR
jgi:hypothetical protein